MMRAGMRLAPLVAVVWLVVPLSASADEDEFQTDRGGRPPLRLDAAELEVGMGVYSRSLRYTQTLAHLHPARGLEEPQAYSLPAAPRGQLTITAFPGANLTNKWWAHIGAELESGFAIPSTARAGDELYRQDHDYMKVGLLGRIPTEHWSFLGRVGWGVLHFEFTPHGSTPSPVPEVAYSFLDLGVGVVYRAGRLRFEVAAAYLWGSDAGQIAEPDWFPNTHFQGAFLRTSVGYRWSRHFSVRFNVESTQLGLDFNPISPDTRPARVAGGATDRLISASMGLVYHVPGAFK